jgi:peptidoglycan hydrolase-like protein with peptidoglycan-binding domain
MQEALLNSGLTLLGGADGVFGPATSNALRLFQSKRGLEVSGSVDSSTAAALTGGGAAVAPVPPAPTPAGGSLVGLAPGTRGPLVVELQQALINAGLSFAGGADGIFGPATANALREFQTSRGLEPTGRVDQATAAALASVAPTRPTPAPSPTPTPAPNPTPNPPSASGFPVFGEQGERVRQMQQALINAGINVPGGADGIFGTMTAGAIMNFQRQRGLEPTGVIDAATASALGLTPATAPPPPPPAADIRLEVFPVARPCSFIDTWHAPRGGGRLHEGTDIIAPEGVEIYAVTSGTITQMYYDRPGSRAGNGLRLSMADGTYFFYAHLLDFAPGIGVGTRVSAGQLLGYNGQTGNAGVPHLHFEIHPGGGAAVNPFPALRALNGCR